MKMAVVGCEASGKTVFMCALADYYGRDAADNPLRLRLTPENAAANSFERFQYRQMRCLRQWPPATPPERTIETKWSLRHEGKSLATIDFLEFGGETFRAAFRDTSDTVRHEGSAAELFNYLGNADFFVVLVSIKALLVRPNGSTDSDFDRETEALWVTRGLLDFIRTRRPKAGAVIGLTQADRYRNELGEAGGPKRLFSACWPTVAATIGDMPVVEVASVSRTDEAGNPADGFHTHGILPVMRIFARNCFGDENALECGAAGPTARRRLFRLTKRLGPAAALLGLATVAAHLAFSPAAATDERFPLVITNTVEKVLSRTFTNTLEKVVCRPVTNTVEKIVEVPVTNTVEKVVRQVVRLQVTNTVEKVVEIPVTNTVEKIVERIITNVVEKTNDCEPMQVPPGFRVWTDYNGRKTVARWTGVAPDEKGISLMTRNNRRIDAVLWKFSPEDQAYIKSEIRRHAEKGELLSDGTWLRNPLLK